MEHFHHSILVRSISRQFAVSDYTCARVLLSSYREVPTSCPRFQWDPLQLKGCTLKNPDVLNHYAIGGVAAYRTCPRGCSRHFSCPGCKELWLPPPPNRGAPKSTPSSQQLVYVWLFSMSVATAGWFLSAHSLRRPGRLHGVLRGSWACCDRRLCPLCWWLPGPVGGFRRALQIN